MRNFFVLILLSVLGGFVCFAQDKVDVETTKTKSAETKINLIVTDKEDKFVTNLSKEDVSLFIDGKEQTEFTLEKETLPLLYMISMDNSGSMRFLLDDVINSAKTLIKQNQSDDLTALMRFVSADIIQTTSKFTSDQNYLFTNLDKFYVQGGQTALIDAIYKSVEIVAHQKTAGDNYRRVVIVISDGEDRDSKNKEKQLSKLLKENDVQVFFIGLVFELGKEGGFTSNSPQKKAINFIESVTEESGGVAVFPKKIEDLPKIANEIVTQMRTQFVIKIPAIENLEKKKVEIKPSKIAKDRKMKFNYRADLIK